MSAIKPVFRELKDAALTGLAALKHELHQFVDAIDDHADDVIRRVRNVDRQGADAPELTGSVTTRVDRTSTELLYRSDSRPPETIFSEGFQVLDASNNDLNTFIHANNPSNFVSTTRDPDLYIRWRSPYRYTVDAPGGIDVDATMPNGPYNPTSHAPEHEIAFQGGIPADRIVGVHPVTPGGGLGEWIANPNYSGRR